jgi:hypothetical protein
MLVMTAEKVVAAVAARGVHTHPLAAGRIEPVKSPRFCRGRENPWTAGGPPATLPMRFGQVPYCTFLAAREDLIGLLAVESYP